MTDLHDNDDLRELIRYIADTAAKFAQMANVGAMETAGGLLSYLDAHPEDLEPFLRGGVHELPRDWFEQGWLTWHGQNGKIVSPEYARRSRIVKKLGQAA